MRSSNPMFRGVPALSRLFLVLVLAILAARPATAGTARVKDLATIAGVRDNQLVGYGLVVGLDGTGDKGRTGFTQQTIANMLEGLGLSLSADAVKVKNVAAVVVTATLPAYAQPGGQIDVVVNSIGDATDLKGGTLVQTPLRGADGEVYAVGQGPLSVGGFNVEGAGGSSVQRNHVTVGRIPNGAIVEREVPTSFMEAGNLQVMLREPDFTTASRMARAINQTLGVPVAMALNPGIVSVYNPDSTANAVDFVSRLEQVEVSPEEFARVIINERTGTIVAGSRVSIGEVAISHGNLDIEVSTQFDVSQPDPLSKGQTEVTPDTQVEAKEGKGNVIVVPDATTIQDVARALNAVGASPRDIISIFQAIKAAGALRAELVIM